MSKATIFIKVLVVSVLLVVCSPIQVFALDAGVILGDADGNNRVSVGDITCIERQILGIYQTVPGASQYTLGSDANGDNVTNMKDVIWVERQILGLETIYGDANGDCIVSQKDVDCVISMIQGLTQETSGADANRDGKVSITDITTIEKMISK